MNHLNKIIYLIYFFTINVNCQDSLIYKNTVLSIEDNKQEHNYLMLIFLICLLIISFLYVLWLYLITKQKTNQLSIQIKNEHNFRINQQQEISLAKVMLNGQEQERSRIAKELHDGIGVSLSTLKLNLSNINQKIQNKDLSYSIKLLDNSITELRQVSHNMMPEIILKYGLKQSLQDFIDELNNNLLNIKIIFNDYGEWKKLSQLQELYIYRIISELVTNAIKHANCNQINIDFIFNVKTFSITIEDNGKGFIFDKNILGIGLQNVKNRVKYLKGSIEFKSELNNGTYIFIQLEY